MWKQSAAITVALLLACCALTLPAADPPAPPVKELPQPSENDLLALCAADSKTLDRESQLFTRYLAVFSGEWEEAQALAFALNLLSRASVVVPLTDAKSRPSGIYAIGNGNLLALRVDLRALYPREKDLTEALKVWESFQFDPRFNLLLTKDTLQFAAGIEIPKQERNVKKRVKKQVQEKDKEGRPLFFVGPDGKPDKSKPSLVEQEVEVEEIVQTNELGGAVNVLRVVAEQLDKTLVAQLVQATGSQAPVVESRYFLFRALSTIKGKGVYETIYSGLYYDLAGIKKGFVKGTDEDNLFAELGIGNVEKGIDARKVFDELRSDQRVAKFRSGITNKPRRIDLLKSLAGRDSQGIVSVTHDLKDEDVDIGTHPIMNLIDLRVPNKNEAREVIFERPNGMHGFALFNNDGVRQDVVPPDVASDHTVPVPGTQQLQCAVSCLRCHGTDGGWKPASNDAKALLNAYPNTTDNSDLRKSLPDAVDRLAGLYNGDLELKVFPRGRDDFANATLRATGPWKKSKAQVDVVQLSCAKVGSIYNKHVYGPVTAQDVLRDLGVVANAKDAPGELRKLLPPAGIIEDARVGGFVIGLAEPRSDADLVYSLIAARTAKTREKKP